MKKSDAQGTVYLSHISWFLTTCWVNIASLLVLAPMSVVLFFYMFTHKEHWLALAVFVFGAAALFTLACWTVYRIAKGIWRWSEARAVV